MNIAIIDDDLAIRRVLRRIIEMENIGKVVFEDDNGGYLDKMDLESDRVDVIVTDLIMPVMNGIEAIKKLNQANYKGIVIMLSQMQDKELIGEAYTLGVEYYISKPINSREVIGIFKKVNEKLILKKIAQEHHRHVLRSQLTSSELRILKLVNEGLTQAQIAGELCITLQTVKNHITNILKKTNLHNSKEVARKAKELELI